MQKINGWVSALIETLVPLYGAGAGEPHDATHPYRMVQIGQRLYDFLCFDFDEFEAAVWLHNLDRAIVFKTQLTEKGLAGLCREFLATSPFDEVARERIVDAVLKHDKLDAPGDSPLLTALRSADRLDWLGPIGVLAGAVHSSTRDGLYNGRDPYAMTDPFAIGQGHPRTFYHNSIYQTEWYAMLPSDEVRAIADPHMSARLHFLRAFAAEVSLRHNVPNPVERDLREALGRYYEKWSPSG